MNSNIITTIPDSTSEADAREEAIRPAPQTKMPTMEEINALTTKHRFNPSGSTSLGPDEGSPLEAACVALGGDELKLYTALWFRGFGIGRQAEIRKSFHWSESKSSRVATRLCKSGYAYRITTPMGYGRMSNQMWMMVFATPIPEELRRIEAIPFEILPIQIQHHIRVVLLNWMLEGEGAA